MPASSPVGMRVGINGFGRIGRQVLKAIHDYHPDELAVVAVNELTDPKTMAHLLKYDSTYGIFDAQIEARDGGIDVDGHHVAVLAERDPSRLPWADLGVELVIESTGAFTDAAKALAHVRAGASKVLITAPAKGEDITIVLGVNEGKYDPQKHTIVSNASCTTNALAPVAKVLHEEFGVTKGLMTTVHSYTSDQRLLDNAHSDLRRARSGGTNIVPTSSGAAKALSLVIPELKGRFHGFALRVPTPTVSLIDFVIETQRPTSIDEINQAFHRAASGSLRGILEVSDVPLVSSDFKGNTASSIVDALLTMVIGGNMVKVLAWYDNEWGYSCRVADAAAYMAKRAHEPTANGQSAVPIPESVAVSR